MNENDGWGEGPEVGNFNNNPTPRQRVDVSLDSLQERHWLRVEANKMIVAIDPSSSLRFQGQRAGFTPSVEAQEELREIIDELVSGGEKDQPPIPKRQRDYMTPWIMLTWDVLNPWREHDPGLHLPINDEDMLWKPIYVRRKEPRVFVGKGWISLVNSRNEMRWFEDKKSRAYKLINSWVPDGKVREQINEVMKFRGTKL